VRIALQGVRGPITVKGKLYEMEMPGLAVLEDEQLAALLTYIRNEWGHLETAVSVAQVAKIRSETQTREEAWKADELEKIP
jgi:mono/diheme cytochrome c family protein